MTIAKGKKRYSIALTEDTVDRFQGILTRYNQPKGMMGVTIDAVLEGIIETFENLEQGAEGRNGEVTIGDFLKALGGALDNITKV